MKKIFKNIMMLFTATTLLVACDNQDLTVLDSTASTTVSLSTDQLVLDILNTGQDVLTVNWTAPDFGYSATPDYNIVFTAGDKSTSIPVGTELSKIFETSELNKVLLNKLGLSPGEIADVTIQIKTDLSNYYSISSNVASITITPYSTVIEPIYMIGGALLGWDTAKAVEVNGTGIGQYEVIAKFNNGGAFRFFSAPDWNATSYNWTYFEGGNVDANFENAQDGDTNIRFIGITGFYKINVNLIDKTITMTAVDEPKHYMVGAGIPDAGWNWNTPVEMTWVKDGLFEATTTFSNDTFRFFTNFGDWGSGRNYPYYVAADFTIDPNFEDAMDGDNNFRFIGIPGIYTVTVDYNNKKITLSQN
ncbi:SusE domain-containing protein [Lutibacter sp.]|uniref:SusE domain-containing protein n=1 Tax=Lutibacter sp. TaxID=1925666 RepID=UPI0025BAA41F|nr:SusE domain-containing protein [Lutibacter sp.]MCF6182028.1 SusE domain-containing protein [Lutibacter sp.]